MCFLCVISLFQNNVFKVHPCGSNVRVFYSLFFSTADNFYNYAIFCLPIHLLMNIWVVFSLCYCKQCCLKHLYTSFPLNMFLIILGRQLGVGSLGHSIKFNLLRNPQTQQLHHFIMLPTVYEGSNFTSLPTLLFSGFFPTVAISGNSVLFHHGLDFHFPNTENL